MKRLALVIVFVLGFVPPAWADFQAGFAAYNRGDYATALREWKPLAEQGDADAQFNLGVMYSHGQGVPQDYAEAVRWYRRAAEQGDADAQFNLGVKYDNGQGVLQNYGEAVKWYRKAAEQGYASAQFRLGLRYANGQGVPQDYTKALKWYRKAAGQGVPEAQFNLALRYDKGEGIPQDYVQALKWYRKAAEQGQPNAQHNLGVMYGKGKGIPQDYVQAHKWYNLAASRLPSGEDRDLAVKNRDFAAGRMTAAQIAEAQRLARDWRPKTQAAPTYDFYSRVIESERVRGVQLNLATLGYKPGPADGILGSRTRSAVEAFQRDHGLPVTGEVSAKMRIVLLQELALQKAGVAPTKMELSD